MGKYTIEDISKMAKERGGECLSEEYINSSTHLTWKCENGHIWQAKFNDIQQGKWCRKCADKKNADRQRKYSIETFIRIAEEHGGKCLSTTYKNNNTPLSFVCADGHTFKLAGNYVLNGQWCRPCSIVTNKELDELAGERGGKCLSEHYINAKNHLHWECDKGHRWKATYLNIKNGTWCPKCASLKYTIEDMKAIAAKNGGECLSHDYVNSSTKLLWKCSSGHIFKMQPIRILAGSWCPHCNFHINEEKCRHILTQIFNTPFIKTQSIFKKLKNRLELDGYSAELNLAFEYQGQQHYQYMPFFHSSEKKFIEQQNRDQKKAEKCNELNIKLLIIPYWVATDDKSIYEFIQNQLKILGFHLVFEENVSYENFYQNLSALNELKEIAESKGGKCLSNYYHDSNTYMELECAEGHRWKAKAINIRQGYWCIDCAGKVKGTIEEMRELAKSRNGKCLSTEYINSETKLLWECSEGHQFKMRPYHVKNGSWCSKCVKKQAGIRRRGNIEDILTIINEKEGELLSGNYETNLSLMEVKCKFGHIWKTTASKIKSGSWCHECGGSKKLTIDIMRELARQKNGFCLSDVYINAHTPLEWKCQEGHIWSAAPANIVQGSWCKDCTNKQKNEKRKQNNFEHVKRIAHDLGGKCLSTEYIGSKAEMQWSCQQNHIFTETAMNIKKGKWCPFC